MKVAGDAATHAVVASICGLLLLGAAALATMSRIDGKVRVAGVAVPEICLMKRSTGIPCPGCGLTRSWIAAAQGDLRASFQWHPLGVVLMAWVAAEGAVRGLWLAIRRLRPLVDRLLPGLNLLAIPIAAAMLVNWVVGLVGRG